MFGVEDVAAGGLKEVKREPRDDLPRGVSSPRPEMSPGWMAGRGALAAQFRGSPLRGLDSVRPPGPAIFPASNGSHGNAPPPSASYVKTPKYTGSSSWEAFHAQFELLADARSWTAEDKALQLALCLEGDALSCLLLLDPVQRRCYDALVGALKRRFGTWSQPALVKNELRGRCRKPGESLRGLANDVECQVRRAYGHMSAEARSELATDLFVGAISPPDLRMQVQLQHPKSLQEALEAAIERESLWSAAAGGGQEAGPHAVRSASECAAKEEVPAWATEMTELLRAVTLQTPRGPRSGPRSGPQVCWGCGRPGHIKRDCPAARQERGNASGSA